MSLTPYDVQQLACAAYAQAAYDPNLLPAAGYVVQQQGAVLARTGVGVWTLTFDTGLGIVDGQTFTRVQPKLGPQSTVPIFAMVEDTSTLVKTIKLYNNLNVAADADFEVSVYKSLINPSGP